MRANSRSVTSDQNGIHPRLDALLTKHLSTAFRKPPAPYSRAAFDAFLAAWMSAGRPPLVLDSCCGTGLSTLNLAARFPDCFVLGIDQSADRLGRHTEWAGELPRNQIRLRADVADIWQLMHEAGIRPARHYLLYPNPWPKQRHLARRWHGHPAFAALITLGGRFECRSNWRLYVEECAAALNRATGLKAAIEPYSPEDGMLTPFEAKYLASGHGLWRCRIDLPPR